MLEIKYGAVTEHGDVICHGYVFLVRFKSDPLAAFTFRAQRRSLRSERKSSKRVRFFLIGQAFSVLLALCEGNPPFLHKWQVMWGFFMFSLLLAWTSCETNTQNAVDLKHYGAHMTSLQQNIQHKLYHVMRIVSTQWDIISEAPCSDWKE